MTPQQQEIMQKIQQAMGYLAQARKPPDWANPDLLGVDPNAAALNDPLRQRLPGVFDVADPNARLPGVFDRF